MPVAVAGEFVASSTNLADQAGESGGNPADKKEGGLGLVLIEQIKDALRVLNNARGPAVPTFTRDLAGKGFYLKVVFYIDAENVRVRLDGRVAMRLRSGAVIEFLQSSLYLSRKTGLSLQTIDATRLPLPAI